MRWEVICNRESFAGEYGAFDVGTAELDELLGGYAMGLEDLAGISAFAKRLLRQNSRRSRGGRSGDRIGRLTFCNRRYFTR